MTLGLVCFSGVLVVRIKSGGRFCFGGLTVLLGSSGDQVSFYTTVGGRVKFKIFKLTAHL